MANKSDNLYTVLREVRDAVEKALKYGASAFEIETEISEAILRTRGQSVRVDIHAE